MNWAGLSVAIGLAALAWFVVTTAPLWVSLGLIGLGALIWHRL